MRDVEVNRPIGVIDSGVGGLTVARELMRQLPKEQLIYLGDTVRCPYGPRPKEEVITFTKQMVNFLLKKDIKLLVIACNTATAFTLDLLKETLPIPVLGVIQPGARAAIKVTETKEIGVIGTVGTIESDAYPDALDNISDDLTVHGLSCPQFVPLVESGNFSVEASEDVVRHALEPLKTFQNLDTLILGCTHYPLLHDPIQKVMGEKVNIISSGEETAREVSAILSYQSLHNESHETLLNEFYTTGSKEIFKQIANRWMDRPIEHIEQVVIDDNSN